MVTINFDDLANFHGHEHATKLLQELEALTGIHGDVVAMDKNDRYQAALDALKEIDFSTLPELQEGGRQ